MPELPEVETIRKDLEKEIVGKKIIRVEIFQKKSIKNRLNKFKKELKNNFITSVQRKGKLLIFELKKTKKHLLVHLRMTGQLIYNKKEKKNEHTGALIYFKDGSILHFNDIRRFGYMKVVDQKEKNKIIDNLGIDLLDKKFTFGKFKNLLKNRNGMLKAMLLNQKMIAGIGNIYADEICFLAKLNPSRKIDSLDDKETKTLYNSIRNIIRLAIKHRGTTFSNYVDAMGQKGKFSKFLKVYKKEGQKCSCCKKTVIEKAKMAGRSTRYCKNCQRQKRGNLSK